MIKTPLLQTPGYNPLETRKPLNQSTTQKPTTPSSNSTDAQLQEARIAKISSPNNKNPLSANDPLDRQAGVYAKGLRIISNPKFQSLPEDDKKTVLSNYYKKYVLSAYSNTDLAAPDEDTWIKGMSIKGGPRMTIHDFYLNRGQNTDALADFESSVMNMGSVAAKTAAHILRGAVTSGIAVDKSGLGLDKYFTGTSDNTWKNKLANVYMKMQNSEIMHQSQDVIDDSNFWFASRPTKTFTEAMGSFVGEQGIQLPLYKAIGVVGTLGAKATMLDKLLVAGKTAEDAGVVAKAANFTRRLAATPQGRWVGRRLKEVADAYIGDALQESYQDRHGDAALFVGLGMLGEIPGGIRLAIGKSAQKKMMANAAEIGGLPFGEAITNEAEEHLKAGSLGTGPDGNPVKVEKGDGPKELRAKKKLVSDADPVKDSLVTGAMLTHQAVAQELYGKDFKNLGKRKQDSVRTLVEHRRAQATEEAPIHDPKTQEQKIKEELEEELKTNPTAGKTLSEINQMFPVKGGTVGAAAEEERKTIKKTTGLTSVQKAVMKSAERNAERRAAALKTRTEAVSKGIQAGVPEASTVTQKATPGEQIGKAPEKLKTKEDIVFSDYSDYGMTPYSIMGKDFNLQFKSKADRAIYKSHAKLEEFFPNKSKAELSSMKAEIGRRVSDMARERMEHPDYKSGEMKYGKNLYIDPIYGETGDKKKVIMDKNIQDVKDFADDMSPIREQFPEAYKQGLDTLVQLQSVTNIIDIGNK